MLTPEQIKEIREQAEKVTNGFEAFTICRHDVPALLEHITALEAAPGVRPCACWEIPGLLEKIKALEAGLPSEQPLTDMPMDRQVIMLNRQLGAALERAEKAEKAVEEMECKVEAEDNAVEEVERLCVALKLAQTRNRDLEKAAEQFKANNDTGAGLITVERRRQIIEEGRTLAADSKYTENELSRAAICYAAPWVDSKTGAPLSIPTHWPWHKSWWKPSDDKIGNLTKAGALIAAEIDRLKGLKNEQ